jgi:hypothetical protein
MPLTNRPKSDYVYKAEDHGRESTPSNTATELTPKSVSHRFSYDT